LPTIILTLAAAVWIGLCVQEISAQSGPTPEREISSRKSKLFASPDTSSVQVGVLENGEPATPIAETVGVQGATWYLIKSKTGVIGWMKRSEAEESKRVEQFFNSLPTEQSLSIARSIPTVSSGAAPRGSIIVPVQMNGPVVIVPVTLNHSLETLMALDTGATRTLLSQRVANSLGLNTSGARALVETANGRVSVAVARLASAMVGEAEVENLIVTVHNFSSNRNLGGLLGLDFLRQFHVALDSQKQVLVLSPR